MAGNILTYDEIAVHETLRQLENQTFTGKYLGADPLVQNSKKIEVSNSSPIIPLFDALRGILQMAPVQVVIVDDTDTKINKTEFQ